MASPLVIRRTVPNMNSKLFVRHLSNNATTAHLPRIAQPSLWSSLVPKFLRRRQPSHDNTTATSTSSNPPSRFGEWLRNPSTTILILALLTGSQAIQVLQTRNDLMQRRWAARRRMDQLHDVLKRIQNGEKVDLVAELGTGDPVAEKEWQDAVDQIADEDFWLMPKDLHKSQRNRATSGGAEKNLEEKGGAVKKIVEEKRTDSKAEEVPRRRAFY